MRVRVTIFHCKEWLSFSNFTHFHTWVVISLLSLLILNIFRCTIIIIIIQFKLESGKTRNAAGNSTPPSTERRSKYRRKRSSGPFSVRLWYFLFLQRYKLCPSTEHLTNEQNNNNNSMHTPKEPYVIANVLRIECLGAPLGSRRCNLCQERGGFVLI